MEQLSASLRNGNSLVDTMLESLREAEAAMREEEERPDGFRPASEKDLATLETVVLEKSDKRIGEMCGVCLERFQNKDVCSRLPCAHTFHKGCCGEWFKRHGNCPLCRFIVGSPPKESKKSNSISSGPLSPTAGIMF